MIVVDGARWGTAAEIAAQLGGGVTKSAVRFWARHDGLPSAKLTDENGRRQVRYPLAEAAAIDARKRAGGRGRKRAALTTA